MKEKFLNLNKTMYELCSDNPGITKLLEAAGFLDITKPGMLATVGKFASFSKGAKNEK